MTQRGETVGAVFPANFMKRMEFIMNKFAENSIEEKVKKELEGNILMAYCNGIREDSRLSMTGTKRIMSMKARS